MAFLPNVSDVDIRAVKDLSRAERDDLSYRINAADPANIFQAGKDSRDPDKRYIICPICGNGKGSDATPVDVCWTGNGWLYNCFKCGQLKGDLIKIIAAEENLNLREFGDMCKALAIGSALIGDAAITPAHQPAPIDDRAYISLVARDIENAAAHLNDVPRDQIRGLSLQTLADFHCGYIEQWTPPKRRLENKYTTATRRLIVPTSQTQYHAVALPADRQSLDKKLWKLHAGKMDNQLFGYGTLKRSCEFAFVVEGEIDAMSIDQAFGKKISVVATLGNNNWRKTLLPHIKAFANKKVVVLFDAEDQTRQIAAELRDTLRQHKIPAACRFFFDAITDEIERGAWEHNFQPDVKVDANELLNLDNGVTLRRLIETIIADAKYELNCPLPESAIDPEEFLHGLTKDMHNARRRGRTTNRDGTDRNRRIKIARRCRLVSYEIFNEDCLEGMKRIPDGAIDFFCEPRLRADGLCK